MNNIEEKIRILCGVFFIIIDDKETAFNNIFKEKAPRKRIREAKIRFIHSGLVIKICT